jgi:nitroreductase
VLTTVARRREDDLRIALGIPTHVEVVAVVPLGWPATPFGTPRRRSLSEVTFLDRWGTPWAAADG